MRAVALAACLCVSIAVAPSQAELIDRVLATVGPRVITLSDVRAVSRLGLIDTAGSADATAAIVQRLIDRTLVLEEVDRYAPPEPSEEAIQQGVATIRARFGRPEEFARAVAASGIDGHDDLVEQLEEAGSSGDPGRIRTSALAALDAGAKVAAISAAATTLLNHL